MIEVLSRLLAMHARIDTDGLIVIDGGFLTRLWGPEPPIYRSLQLVLHLADDEPTSSHVVSVEATFDADHEQVARVEAHVSLGQSPSVLLIPLVLHLRRQGDYSVAVRVDGDEVARLPLNATFRLE